MCVIFERILKNFAEWEYPYFLTSDTLKKS